MKLLALALILAAGSALADETPKPPATPPTMLTVEEGRALYKLGVTEGMARAAVQAAQQEAKSALEKINPSATAKP